MLDPSHGQISQSATNTSLVWPVAVVVAARRDAPVSAAASSIAAITSDVADC